MISLNNRLKPSSNRIIRTTKKAENSITASVSPQVDFLSGQRTNLSSSHEPLKYPIIFENIDFFFGFVGFSVSLALGFVGTLDDFSFLTTSFTPNLKSLPKADCQVLL